jgi:hypothetical protein
VSDHFNILEWLLIRVEQKSKNVLIHQNRIDAAATADGWSWDTTSVKRGFRETETRIVEPSLSLVSAASRRFGTDEERIVFN